MGKRRSSNYRKISKMSNGELKEKLEAYAKWYSKTVKTASIADDILKDLGLPRCDFKDDFKSKIYHDKLYEEATRRQIEIPQEWYEYPVTNKDVLDRIETAYYMHIRSDSRKTRFNVDNSNAIDATYEMARTRARTLKLKKVKK